MMEFRKLPIIQWFSAKTFGQMGTDISLVALQAYCLSVKFSDNFGAQHPPADSLAAAVRQKYVPYYFMADNYRTQLMIEAVCILLFLARAS